MKKSKIIVPALGILAFSTAAAVTGTVAWFTANRQVNINASAITAYNPEEGLKVTLSNAKGASIGTAIGSGATAATVTHNQLRDSSVDLINEKVYRSILNDEGSAVASYGDVTSAATAGTEAGSYTVDATTTKYYWCSIYTAEFQLDAAKSSETYTLKYDNTKLTTTNANSLAIAPALRVGIRVSNSIYTVISPFAAAGSKSYVNGLTLSNTETYTTLGSDKLGNLSMGTLSGSTVITATIYTWFEGLDAACVNNNVDTAKNLTVGLSFTISQQ